MLPGQEPARNARNAIKPQGIKTWLNSFKDCNDSTGDSKNYVSNIVKSSTLNASCSMDVTNDSPKIVIGPVANEVTTSSNTVISDNYFDDLKSQLRDSVKELGKKHPVKKLRSRDCLQSGASLDVLKFVNAFDRVDRPEGPTALCAATMSGSRRGLLDHVWSLTPFDPKVSYRDPRRNQYLRI